MRCTVGYAYHSYTWSIRWGQGHASVEMQFQSSEICDTSVPITVGGGGGGGGGGWNGTHKNFSSQSPFAGSSGSYINAMVWIVFFPSLLQAISTGTHNAHWENGKHLHVAIVCMHTMH